MPPRGEVDAAEGSLPENGVERVEPVASRLGGIVTTVLGRVVGFPAVGTPAISGELPGEVGRPTGGDIPVAALV